MTVIKKDLSDKRAYRTGLSIYFLDVLSRDFFMYQPAHKNNNDDDAIVPANAAGVPPCKAENIIITTPATTRLRVVKIFFFIIYKFYVV